MVMMVMFGVVTHVNVCMSIQVFPTSVLVPQKAREQSLIPQRVIRKL